MHNAHAPAMSSSAVPKPAGSAGSASSGPVTLATYDSYALAQQAVDRLSDAGFAVEHCTIVGDGLKFVEQVTGRLSWWKAMLSGFVRGALIGLTVGLLMSLFTVDQLAMLPVVLWAGLYGAVIGSILGLLGYALTGGKRDFTSAGSFAAERFHVQCDAAHADQARRLLNAET